MRKVSIYFLFGLFIMTSVSIFDWMMTKAEWEDYYDRTFARKAARLNNEGYISQSIYFANEDKPQVLLDFLESRRRNKDIHFWVMYKNGKVVDTSIPTEDLWKFEFNLEQPGDTIHTGLAKEYFYATEDLSNGHQLVIGLRRSMAMYVEEQFDLQRSALFKYMIGVFIITFGTFVYFFRDIMASIRQLTNRGGRSYGHIHAKSKEADLLLRGFAAYEDRTIALEKEKDVLKDQVLPSLRTEIMSGRQPPYEFACTLVRTDINNFSKIYNEYNVEEFAATINDFFTDVSHIVSRYNGLVHEFVGDEVIYYFKDEDVGNSVAAALSAIRDINVVAARYSRMTLHDRGYPFTVKSSFAHGSLRFGKFVNGFNLAGPSLIETVRVLSQITEKDGNVVVFDERHLDLADVVSQSEHYADVRLKGFSDEKRLYVYRAHHSIELLLEKGDSQSFETLMHFRGDEDITQMLTWARHQDPSGDFKVLNQLVGMLRQMPVTRTNGVPQQMLVLWIEDLIRDIQDEHVKGKADRVKILASALRLIENLVPRSEFTHQFESTLQKALDVDDRRVVANALEALTLFRRDYEPAMAERLTSHPDNRIAANALVHEGIRHISPFVIKRLQKMLDSQQPAPMASALYAMGEIARHHRAQDLVYYQTQVDFLRFVQELPLFVLHKDAMVRRQAMIAARKCGDESVVQAIWEVVRNERSSALALEARDYLGGSDFSSGFDPGSNQNAA